MILSLEANLLRRLGQPVTAGFFEDKNAPVFARTARVLRRYAELAAVPAPTAGPLYPSGSCSLWGLGCRAPAVGPQALTYGYSPGLSFHWAALEALRGQLQNPAEQQILAQVVEDLSLTAANPLSCRFRVGGCGYTHSILNYGRILREGLDGYRHRAREGLAAATAPDRRSFFEAALETLDAVAALHASLLAALRAAPADPSDRWRPRLLAAFSRVPAAPPRDFLEAMVAFNFLWYLDGCDSVGRFDQILFPYWRDSRGGLAEADLRELLTAFWRNMDDNSGWHLILGGGDAAGRPAYNELTAFCLETMHGFRRPNAGLRVRRDQPDDIWEKTFDCMASGSGNPALYNEEAYAAAIPERTGVTGPDAAEFAFGGCTELMFHGLSNVGSLDAGINLVEVLDATIKARLATASSFDAFLAAYRSDLEASADRMLDEVDLNQEYKALYRPLPIRTLFIDDCLERGVEYNAGGARYNGSVVNVGGLANAANSLFVIRQAFAGRFGAAPAELAGLLADDWRGHDDLRAQAAALDKYGNGCAEVDALAATLAGWAFDRITARRCRRAGGFYLPACLMFVTFANEGRDVDATPDGRRRSTPVADSIGPMQGTDLRGPTAMLQSVAALPQHKGIGTLVLNLRLPRELFIDPAARARLKGLIRAYFDLGGLQIQFTVVDERALADAMQHPEKYESLVVRIGGYTEYFNRLPQELKEEVLKRTAHAVVR
jgi:pyruvate-formate lyase